MATKKIAPKKNASPTFLEKITEKASHLKDKLLEEKDHVVQVAGETFDAVKEKIHEFRAKKTVPVKKKATRKKAVRQPAKKVAVKAGKAVKKTVRKVTTKKVTKKAVSRGAKRKSK